MVVDFREIKEGDKFISFTGEEIQVGRIEGKMIKYTVNEGEVFGSIDRSIFSDLLVDGAFD